MGRPRHTHRASLRSVPPTCSPAPHSQHLGSSWGAHGHCSPLSSPEPILAAPACSSQPCTRPAAAPALACTWLLHCQEPPVHTRQPGRTPESTSCRGCPSHPLPLAIFQGPWLHGQQLRPLLQGTAKPWDPSHDPWVHPPANTALPIPLGQFPRWGSRRSPLPLWPLKGLQLSSHL